MIDVVNDPGVKLRLFEKKVTIAAPWYRDVCAQTAFSFSQLRDRRRTSTLLNFGDAFVAHTRNKIVDAFLATESEYLLTIDSDMIVPFGNPKWFKSHCGWPNYPEPFASFNAVDRLMSHGKTLVGALYFSRQKINGPPVFGEGGNDEVAKRIREICPCDEVLKTRWVGTGCMLVHRSVFEDIEKKFPALARKPCPDGLAGGHWFTSSEHELLDAVQRVQKTLAEGSMTGEKCLKAYEMLASALAVAKNQSNLGMGEDVTFCVRAAQSGHPSHVDLGLRCGHIGDFVF